MKKLVITVPKTITSEIRCENCHALLYRVLGKSYSVTYSVEIKCKRCGHMNRGGAWTSVNETSRNLNDT